MNNAKDSTLPFWIFYNPDALGHDIYVEEFGFGVCSPGYIFSETRRNYLLEFVFDGIEHVTIGNQKTFTVTKGNAFLLPPNVVHSYQSDIVFPSTRAWISWSGILTTSLEKHLKNNSNPYLINVTNLDNVIELFHKLKNSRTRSPASIMSIYSCFYEILSNCMNASTELSETQTREALLVNDIIQYIDNNIMFPLSISDICKKFGYDNSSIFRKFKQHIGLSLKEYIQHRRLALAKGLIRETDLPMDEIVVRCGFNERAALNMLFVRHTNMSLAKYMAENRHSDSKDNNDNS